MRNSLMRNYHAVIGRGLFLQGALEIRRHWTFSRGYDGTQAAAELIRQFLGSEFVDAFALDLAGRIGHQSLEFRELVSAQRLIADKYDNHLVTTTGVQCPPLVVLLRLDHLRHHLLL